MLKKLVGVSAAMALFIGQAEAAVPLMPGPWDPGNALGTINSWIQNQLNPTVQASSGAILARNVLDNGDMMVMQRLGASAEQSCGQTSGPTETAYAADRWACDVNVTSGAGKMLTQATSAPTPPSGFKYESQLYRKTGALAQPVCAEQEILSTVVQQIAGQTVILSAYLADLGGLAADQGTTNATANLVIITGTTADEGLGTGPNGKAIGMTASPAITPAWTGLATASTTAVTLSTSMAVYNSTPTVIPGNANEVAVLLCFTPTTTAGKSGTTDGIAFTGVQLVPVQGGITAAPAYEHKNYYDELRNAQKYWWAVYDAAAHTILSPMGLATTTAACELDFTFPQTMAFPATYASLGTPGTGFFKILNNAQAEATFTTLAQPGTSATLNSQNQGAVLASVITGTPLTAGQACALVGQGVSTTNALSFGADF